MIDFKANILIVWNYAWDAKFSRNYAWGCQIPCSVGDTKSTEGVPKSLGDLARGCQILGGAGVTGNLASPVYGTPESNILGKINTPVQFFLVSTVLSKFSHQEILYPPHAAAAPWRENR